MNRVTIKETRIPIEKWTVKDWVKWANKLGYDWRIKNLKTMVGNADFCKFIGTMDGQILKVPVFL